MRRLSGVDFVIGKLLQVAVIFDAWETGVVLPIRLHNTDGILRMDVGDLELSYEMCAGCVVEYRQRLIPDTSWM